METQAPPKRRLISTGFAPKHDHTRPIRPDQTLETARTYVYWFEINDQLMSGAIDDGARRTLPLSDAPAGTPLTVGLFGFPGELKPEPGMGEFVLTSDDGVRVSRQPHEHVPWEPSRGTRLYFLVRTPPRPGRYKLRCNLYCRQTLLQSRLIEAEVTEAPRTAASALRSTVDYTVTGTLHPRLLAATRPLRLSIMFNDNDNGTHGFRFLGEHDLQGDAVVDGHALQDLLDRARRAYRLAAWNSELEWQPEWENDITRYAYLNPPGPERLSEDLIRMARAGYRLWTTLSVQLASAVRGHLPPDRAPQRSLQDIMREGPGFIEVAAKFSARMVIPASINADLSVCPSALSAITAGHDLATHPCFGGDCANYDDDTVVCPGGFWGFRHNIGLPQSRATDSAGDEPDPRADGRPVITCEEKPEFVIGVAEDLNGDHVARVQSLGDARSRSATTRDALLAELRAHDFGGHIIYFFCHGTVVNGIPALQIGLPGSPGITQDNIQDGRMYWASTQPLVFLNGCSTAAVEPRYALNLVDAFVRGASASGVIGTEITVFASLAAQFAEEFYTRFLDHDEPVGEAIRRARLRVLQSGNPLGLVYIAYTAPQLKLVP